MFTLRRYTLLLVIPLALGLFTGCPDDEKKDDPDNRESLSGEQTGTISSGTYLMTDDVLVPNGATLRIDPGVKVFVNGNHKFEVKGRLVARGMEDDFIHFTTDLSPRQKGDWKGIWLNGADDSSVLEYVQVSYANKYNIIEDTTRVYTGSGPGIRDTVLHRGAVTIRNCSPTIRRCIIDNTGYDAIQIVGESSPNILYNTIVLNAFNGIRIEPEWPDEAAYGTAVIRNNIIVENDDAGIRGDNGITLFTTPDIAYNDIWNNASLNYLPLEILDILGPENVSLNPEFVSLETTDGEELDLNLHPCSGAIDKGDPDDPDDSDGTRADVGVFSIYQYPNHLSNELSGDRLDLKTSNYDVYYVTCDVVVPDGETLKIGPGVAIRFVEDFRFVINGKIEAVGNANNPIVFTSDREVPRRGDWKNIYFENTTSGSKMEHVVVEYAGVDNIADPFYVGAISMEGSSPSLKNIEINEAYNTGVFCYNGSSPSIENMTIEGVGVYGMSFKLNSNPSLKQVRIHDVQGYGLRLERNCSPTIRNILIYDVIVSGIVMDQLCNPVIRYATVYGQDSHGLRMNLSNPDIKNSIISHYGKFGIEKEGTSFPVLSYLNLYSPNEAAVALNGNDLTNEVTGDPKFVNPENGNFQLQGNSPCKGAADNGSDLGFYGGN